MEVAANTWKVVHAQGGEARITLQAGKRLMAPFPDKVRQLAIASLQARNIEVIEGAHLRALSSGQAVLDNGLEIPFDVAFLALGLASSLFADSGMRTGPDGGMLVNEYLHVVDYPNIFGGGDCISFQPRPLTKVGVYAVRHVTGVLA